MTVYIVKASVLSTVERVLGPDDKKQRLTCWILQGVTGLCGIASFIVILVSCDATSLLTAQRNDLCSGQVSIRKVSSNQENHADCLQTTRWIATTLLDAITELSTFIVFCFFMSGLQMRNGLKTTIILLLGFRLG